MATSAAGYTMRPAIPSHTDAQSDASPPSNMFMNDLPQEVRDMIYGYALQGRRVKADLAPGKGVHLLCNTQLLRVCRVMHDEIRYFLIPKVRDRHVPLLGTEVVRATVVDFNFRSLLAELRKLNPAEQTSTRLIVNFRTRTPDFSGDQLGKWIAWVSRCSLGYIEYEAESISKVRQQEIVTKLMEFKMRFAQGNPEIGWVLQPIFRKMYEDLGILDEPMEDKEEELPGLYDGTDREVDEYGDLVEGSEDEDESEGENTQEVREGDEAMEEDDVDIKIEEELLDDEGSMNVDK